MGKRGPKPKKSIVPRSAPAPEPPFWLEEQSRRRWMELIPQLQALGILHDVDFGVLARYCSIWSQWLDCQATIQTAGLTQHILSAQGDREAERPEVSIANKLHEAMLRIENAMGMTAASRQSLVKPEPEKPKENPFEVLRALTG